MKAFNFDEPTERRDTGSYKWDSADADVIPLWVADMDFRTAPCIIDALSDRVRHGVFGYEKVPDAWYEALQGWFARRHGWQIRREEVLCTTGVVPAVSAVIKAFTRPGDGVALMTPAYNCFFSSIRNNGCFAAETALLMGNAGWTIDFAALEKTLADPRVKVFLFCSPHNPVGRVWTADEIRRTAQIAHQAGVLFVCDEIHGEFVFGGSRYLPAAQVEGVDPLRTVILTSPTKTFNLAGAGIAAIIAADPKVRAKIDRAVNDNECCDVNVFGVAADIAAWNQGEAWLEALLYYLQGNLDAAQAFFAEKLPLCRLSKLEGTYLLWADMRPMLGADLDTDAFCESLKTHEKVWAAAGSHYGRDGEGFVRINIATQRALLLEGLTRLAAGAERWQNREKE